MGEGRVAKEQQDTVGPAVRENPLEEVPSALRSQWWAECVPSNPRQYLGPGLPFQWWSVLAFLYTGGTFNIQILVLTNYIITVRNKTHFSQREHMPGHLRSPA